MQDSTSFHIPSIRTDGKGSLSMGPRSLFLKLDTNIFLNGNMIGSGQTQFPISNIHKVNFCE